MQSQLTIAAGKSTSKLIKQNVLLLIAAFAAVYLIWGSTYIAIKYAIQTLPPFLMAGTRFLVAGAILYLIARFSANYQKPNLKHWRSSLIVGTLLLFGGNGGVVLAEHYIPSSLAALLIATEPLWIFLLNWLMLKAERPNLRVVIGLILGFIGVGLLIGQNVSLNDFAGNYKNLLGAFLVIGAAFSWALGSLYGLRAPVPASPVLTSAMQMLAGSAVFLLVGSFSGEWSRFDLANASTNSLLALFYLIVFGSVIAFTAYSWLLKVASPALVATYAYVNPVVAVFLGWALANESLTPQMLFGAAVIVGSIILITSQSKR